MTHTTHSIRSIVLWKVVVVMLRNTMIRQILNALENCINQERFIKYTLMVQCLIGSVWAVCLPMWST